MSQIRRQLEEQAFAKVARADARRVEPLNHQHRPFHLLGSERLRIVRDQILSAVGNPFRRRMALLAVSSVVVLLGKGAKPAVIGDVGDHVAKQLVLLRLDIEERQLFDQKIMQRRRT